MKHIKHQWRVTKYNPTFRDEHGYYTLIEEWTSPSDIGETFDGNELTLDDYLRVEEAYINSAIAFMEESGIQSVRVLGLEGSITEEDRASFLYESEFEGVVLKEDSLVDLDALHLIMKMVLRDFIWCQLYDGDQFFIHFGTDYYMYVGSHVNCPAAIEWSATHGLFVESEPSPYGISEEDAIWEIGWNDLDSESKILVGKEDVTGIPLDGCRRIFHHSADHPVTGAFDIPREEKEFFQRYLKHQMNFDLYEYRLWGGD
ncbi:hypothetical protein M1I95_17665 [Rossellomorea marisflavi]|uniref:DUF7683 domain-containing protein n=1 Tax=Rossellomorea marisflavi TaxID=189381 RepID=UPI0027A0BB8E|nr:hypothetical protein [Rossellomorea marisflavi]UTE72069.1 hypothetical protein M1I95_17665 [Rossellomorea marisflavi]